MSYYYYYLYLDDCCIFTHSNAVINALIDSLKSEFVLKDQGPIKDYLGICIDQQINPKTNFIECMTLTQVGLVDEILNNLGFLPNGTYPSHKQVKMHSTTDGEGHTPGMPWCWLISLKNVLLQSIVGKLTFLLQSIHPDVTYAINTCACY